MQKGDKVKLLKVSITSMQAYQTYRDKGLKLICPCSIKAKNVLTILEIFDNNLCTVRIGDNPHRISIVTISDIIKV